MKRLSLLLIILISLPCFTVFAVDTGTLARSLTATALVAYPEKTAEEIIAWTDARAGYFLLHSSDMVILRVPVEHIGVFKAFLEDISEELPEFSMDARDMSEEITALRSGIQARQEIMDKNISYIDGADVKGTLAIEQEVTRLLREIESMKGRLNRIMVDVRMALIQVSFTFRDESLPSDIPSSFELINRMDFYRFMREAF